VSLDKVREIDIRGFAMKPTTKKEKAQERGKGQVLFLAPLHLVQVNNAKNRTSNGCPLVGDPGFFSLPTL
jgi:hypothetical protein